MTARMAAPARLAPRGDDRPAACVSVVIQPPPGAPSGTADDGAAILERFGVRGTWRAAPGPVLAAAAARGHEATDAPTAAPPAGGINRGVFDAAAPRETPLYGPDAVYREAMALIDGVARGGGWLIFVTGGVSERPGPQDTPAPVFAHILRSALAAGCTVAPVGTVARDLLSPVPGAQP